MKLNGKLKSFGVALILSSSLLTGCVTGSSGGKASPYPSINIYQPMVLTLPAGNPVQTETGVYVPQTREVWHSQSRYRTLELQVVDLAAALAQERARK